MRYVFIPLVIGLMVFIACVNTGTGEFPHDQTTVLGTLLLFVDAWNDCDINTYAGLLTEDFTFYFDPQDVGDHGLPPTWGYEEEIEAVTNLFDAVGAENIDVELDLSEVDEPGEGTDTYKVGDIPYYGEVIVEDTTYTFEGILDMRLDKTSGQWFITDWWDFASSELLVIPCTWGVIKAEF